MDNNKQTSLNILFGMPEWQDEIALERQLREDAILKLISLPIDDPSYSTKSAFLKGVIDTYVQLWSTRAFIRKNGTSLNKQKKGEKNADNET